DLISAQDLDRQATRAELLAQQKLGALADAQTAAASAREAHAQIAAARAAVDQAKASLDQAKINLAYTTIVSPIDGTVISRNVDVGQTVAASLAAPTLFEIAQDLRKVQVDTSVAEADVGRLTQGMPAAFTVDAYPDRDFVGRVRQIRNAPQTVQNVVTYDAVIDVANPDLRLKPGMTANVSFVDAKRSNALRIPNAALRFHPTFPISPAGKSGHGHAGSQGHGQEGSPSGFGLKDSDPSRRVVWKLVGGVPEPARVRLGITDGFNTEVVSGKLATGDLVITDESAGNGASPQRRMGFRMF
ncbi:MAG: efflux RND transporter periplasmic adaptor subunit, partial [Cyanobacteria bacterium REEB65]|nr:efflux RND transporter periplasmic adaptor subunit [Cyanobacteria bacterium REEB65]